MSRISDFCGSSLTVATLKMSLMIWIRFAVVTLLAALPAFPSTLSGTITDPTGAVIEGASVAIRWDSAGHALGLKSNEGTNAEIKTTTDKLGHFSLELPQGFYDVFVSGMAFSPSCVKVRLLTGRSTKRSFKLRLDPSVTAELGDNFPVKQ